jgi:hypothetical protein
VRAVASFSPSDVVALVIAEIRVTLLSIQFAVALVEGKLCTPG